MQNSYPFGGSLTAALPVIRGWFGVSGSIFTRTPVNNKLNPVPFIKKKKLKRDGSPNIITLLQVRIQGRSQIRMEPSSLCFYG